MYEDPEPELNYILTTFSSEKGDSFSGALSRVEGESVGTYAFTFGTLTAGANYYLTFVGADFRITPKSPTITADTGQTKMYGGTESTLTYSVNTGSLEKGDSFLGVLSRVTGEDVGRYAIIMGGLTAGSNYKLTFVGADFSITNSH